MNASAKMLEQNLFTFIFDGFLVSKLQGVALALSLIVLVSSFAVVYVKDLHRRLFVEKAQLESRFHSLQLEQGQLLLERSSLLSHARIQRVAQDMLQMEIPHKEQVILVRQ